MAKKKGPPKEPSRRHGIHRFEEVLSAAEALITEGTPLDELTLQGVAKKAGVPRVSLYYFFPSVDALVEALYQRVLTRLMNELATAEIKPSADWRTVVKKVFESVMKHYSRNRLTTVLALMPSSLTMINQAHRVYGQGLAELLEGLCGLKRSAKLTQGCEIAAELATTIFRKSFIEKGAITPVYQSEAQSAVIAYLTTVIEK